MIMRYVCLLFLSFVVAKNSLAIDKNIWLCKGLITLGETPPYTFTTSIAWLDIDTCSSRRAEEKHNISYGSGSVFRRVSVKITVTEASPLNISNNLEYASELASIMQMQIDSLRSRITTLEKQILQKER